jgi:hypothetical protein
VGDHQVAVRGRGQFREPLQLDRSQQMRVVDQQCHVRRERLSRGRDVVPDGYARFAESPGYRFEEHGLAVAARADDVDPAYPGGTGGGLSDEAPGDR